MGFISQGLRKPSTQLLVLIAIAAIGFLLWPTVSCTPLPASYSITANNAYHLKNAIQAYHTEFEQYPLEGFEGPLSSGSEQPLMSILQGTMSQQLEPQNPRRIDFFSGKPAKTRKGKPHSGWSLNPEGSRGLWDAWGNPYRVRLDYDQNHRVENPEPNPKIGGSPIPESILVWSAGSDGNFSTWEDNIKTW